MKHFKYLVLLLSVAILSSCATGAKQGAMVPASLEQVGLSQKYQSSIVVNSVAGGKTTNPLWVSNISNDAFRKSLISSLTRKGYFNGSGPNRLDVNLLGVKQPLAGIDMTVTTNVRYTLKDAGGNVLFDKTISAPYTAKFSDSLVGVERLRLANEGSARENIKEFLVALGKS